MNYLKNKKKFNQLLIDFNRHFFFTTSVFDNIRIYFDKVRNFIIEFISSISYGKDKFADFYINIW